jgi:hypothetical protein
MKFYSEANLNSITNLEKKIDFLTYVSELLAHLSTKAQVYDIRQVEYFLSMTAVEASDSLDHLQKTLNQLKTTAVLSKSARQ